MLRTLIHTLPLTVRPETTAKPTLSAWSGFIHKHQDCCNLEVVHLGSGMMEPDDTSKLPMKETQDPMSPTTAVQLPLVALWVRSLKTN